MKNNRPVFESFSAFVNFINEAEAPMDFKGFLSSNSSFLDADAKKGFDAARLVSTKAPLSQGKGLSSMIGEDLGSLNSYIKDLIDDNNKNPQGVQTTEKTTTEVKKVIYPALVNGKVNIAEAASVNAVIDSRLPKAVKANSNGSWIDINDLLNLINLDNLLYINERPTSVDYKGKKWKEKEGYKDFALNTGAEGQNLISSIASGINFVDNGNAIPGKSAKILPELAFSKKDANSRDDKKVYRTLILYGVGNIAQGEGDTIPDTFVKKEFTKETVTGAVKAYQVPVDGGDAMFEQGSAKLNMKNKANIDKLLTAALAPLAGKPESIVITGGASYEPDGQGPINKKLVVDRANEIKTQLETLYPDLKGVITVKADDFSKIQAEKVPAEYEKYRKVYLDVKGVLLGDSYTIDKETEYLVDGEIKADTVEIIQYAISLEFDLVNDKEA
jgi:hypothetical protein